MFVDKFPTAPKFRERGQLPPSAPWPRRHKTRVRQRSNDGDENRLSRDSDVIVDVITTSAVANRLNG